MSVRTIRQFLSQKNIPSGFDRQSLIRIATALVFTIAVLGLIQWATAFRGDLLWVTMVGLSVVLIGLLLAILRGRPLTAEEWAKHKSDLGDGSGLPWNQPSWHDPSDIGSPLYRDD